MPTPHDSGYKPLFSDPLMRSHRCVRHQHAL